MTKELTCNQNKLIRLVELTSIEYMAQHDLTDEQIDQRLKLFNELMEILK